ncbi:hypothetical protein ACFL35_12755 [Candidatus Riflebacteria bacterium]
MGWKKIFILITLLCTTIVVNASDGVRNMSASGNYGEETYVVTYTDQEDALPVLINIWAPVEARRTVPPPELDRAAGEPMGGPLDDPNLGDGDKIPWAPEDDINHKDETIKGEFKTFGFPFTRLAPEPPAVGLNTYFHKVRYVGIEPFPVMKINAGHAFTETKEAIYDESYDEYGEVIYGKLLTPAVYEKTGAAEQEFNTDVIEIYKNEGEGSEDIPYVIKVLKGGFEGKFLAFKNLKYTWNFMTTTTKKDVESREEQAEETATFAKYDPFAIKQVVHQHNNPFDPGVTLDELEAIASSGEYGGDQKKKVGAEETVKAALDEFRQPVTYTLTYEMAMVKGEVSEEPTHENGKFEKVGVFNLAGVPEEWQSTTHNAAGLTDDDGNTITGKGMLYVEDYEVPVLQSDQLTEGDTGDKKESGVKKKYSGQVVVGNSGGFLNHAIKLSGKDIGTSASVNSHFKWAIGRNDRYWLRVPAHYTSATTKPRVIYRYKKDKSNNYIIKGLSQWSLGTQSSKLKRDSNCTMEVLGARDKVYKVYYWKLPFAFLGDASGQKYAGPLSDEDKVSRIKKAPFNMGYEMFNPPSNIAALIKKADLLWDPVLGSYCVGPMKVGQLASRQGHTWVVNPKKIRLPKHFNRGNPEWKNAKTGARSYQGGERVGTTVARGKEDLPFVVLVQDCCNNATQARGTIIVNDKTKPNIYVGLEEGGGGDGSGNYTEPNDERAEGVGYGSGQKAPWSDNRDTWNKKAKPVGEDKRIMFRIGALDENGSDSISSINYKLSGKNMKQISRGYKFKPGDKKLRLIKFPHVFRKVGDYKLNVTTKDLVGNGRTMNLAIPVIDASMRMGTMQGQK